MEILWFLLIGAVAGWIAGMIMGRGSGLIINSRWSDRSLSWWLPAWYGGRLLRRRTGRLTADGCNRSCGSYVQKLCMGAV